MLGAKVVTDLLDERLAIDELPQHAPCGSSHAPLIVDQRPDNDIEVPGIAEGRQREEGLYADLLVGVLVDQVLDLFQRGGRAQPAEGHDCRTSYRTAIISPKLKARRAHAAPDCIEIADRCLRRLHKKGNRLLFAGKHPNKVKVACAREMVGFVWESLRKVAA